jgi:hypothetical protein
MTAGKSVRPRQYFLVNSTVSRSLQFQHQRHAAADDFFRDYSVNWCG